jgi:hypothetical protein
MAAGWMRSSIKSRASFDIDELEIERVANATFCPALFAHGDEDDFIDKAHSARLREKYAGDSKPLLVFDGDHNSPRPAAFFDDVELFFRQTMWETPAETSARRREEAMNDARRNGDTSAPSVSRAAENTGVIDARSSGGEKEKETNRAEVSSRRVASSSPRRNAQQRDAHRDTVVRVRDVLASPGASPPERREALGALKSMGFESPRATYALRRAGGDLEEALAFLLDDDDDFLDSSRRRARDSRNDDDAFVATDLFAVSDAGGSAAYEASALVASDASDADLARALALSLELADAEARAREGE